MKMFKEYGSEWNCDSDIIPEVWKMDILDNITNILKMINISVWTSDVFLEGFCNIIKRDYGVECSVQTFSKKRKGTLKRKQCIHMTFNDGTSIPVNIPVNNICSKIWKNMQFRKHLHDKHDCEFDISFKVITIKIATTRSQKRRKLTK